MTETVEMSRPLKKRRKESMFLQVLKRLAKNPVAMTGVGILVVILVVSILAPLIAPYDPNFMD